MKCAYTAGILDKFLDYNLTFDLAVGVSAGASCTASYIAEQYDRNRRFFVEHVNNPNYLGIHSLLKTGSLFGLDYIYSEITNSDGEDPLDYDTFINSPVEYYAVATDAKTGKPRYFGKSEVPRDDYQVFKASSAIPVACKPIQVRNNLYFDGGISDPIPVKFAETQGCKKMVLVLCRPKDTIREEQDYLPFIKKALRRYPETFERIAHRHETYNDTLSYAKWLEEEGKLYIIAPKDTLPVSTYTKDPAVLQQLYDIAFEEFEAEKDDLFAFLNKE